MAYKITDGSISYGSCEPECPNEAISGGETVHVIDPDRGSECVDNFESPKCVEVCPVDCCISGLGYKESRQQLLEKWQKLTLSRKEQQESVGLTVGSRKVHDLRLGRKEEK